MSSDDLESIEELREQHRVAWRKSGLHRGQNMIEALHDGFSSRAESRIEFLAEGHTADLSLREMYDQGDRVATVLYEMGVRPGGRVAIQVPNWPEATVAHYAALLLRAVIVPVPSIYGPTEVKFILEDAKVDTYFLADRWGSHDYIAALPEVSKAKYLERIIVVGDDVPTGCVAWQEIAERAARAEPTPVGEHHVDAQDVCFTIYTSGSTSNPKGGIHSHDTMVAELMQKREYYSTGSRLQGFPGGHVAGLLGTWGPILHGQHLFMMDQWDAAVAAPLISERKITAFTGAPFYLATLLDEADSGGYSLRSIHEMLVGSAGVPPILIERAQDAGFNPYRAYGSTEHPTISSNVPEASLESRSKTDGPLLPNVEAKIVDEDDRTLPAGMPGEILSRGPDQFLHYTDREANRATLAPEGWFRTGDVGWFTPDGELVISDRKKDVIIRGGENLSSQEIEDILLRHPSVSEVSVIGAPDPLYGERACAFVVLHADTELSLDDVRSHFVSAGVARQKTPEILVVKDELPRTAAGKVKKFMLRDELVAQDLPSAPRPSKSSSK
jgi:acyl-CoA synthetase (AMP-forming)/AMP-acid ligase II